jgi:hypothetical protein
MRTQRRHKVFMCLLRVLRGESYIVSIRILVCLPFEKIMSRFPPPKTLKTGAGSEDGESDIDYSKINAVGTVADSGKLYEPDAPQASTSVMRLKIVSESFTNTLTFVV